MVRKSSIDYRNNVRLMLELIKTTPVVFFDLETTGLRKECDRILSFSAVKCEARDGKLKETGRLDLLINPGFSIPAGATAINHITNEMVADAPTEKEAYGIIHDFLGDDPLLCGYNSVSFDEKFMNSMYLRQSGRNFTPVHHTDVMKMAKENLELSKYKLSDVAHEMGCDMNIRFHTSMDDVIATRRLFVLLVPNYREKNTGTGTRRVSIEDVRFWSLGHRLTRLYIQTYPYSNTYFDIYKKEWKSDMDGLDLKQLIMDVLSFTGTRTEQELSKKASTYR